jgi:hypothetical protein
MSQWKLNQLTNLRHLLSATTDVIVADLIEVSLFVFALYWLAFAMNHCVLCNDAVRVWVDLNNLELDLSHACSDCKEIALSHRSVGFAKIWGKEDIEEGASEAFDCVCNGKDSDSLGLESGLVACYNNSGMKPHVFDVWTRVHCNDVAVFDT